MRTLSKFRNRRVEVDGLKFDSVKESKRWAELQFMERAGEIKNLQRQVRIPIVINGVKVCTYIADFTYEELGGVVVEDVKSEFTQKDALFRLKAKLLRVVLGIDIRIT